MQAFLDACMCRRGCWCGMHYFRVTESGTVVPPSAVSPALRASVKAAMHVKRTHHNLGFAHSSHGTSAAADKRVPWAVGSGVVR
jgi:hypothetical protein